MGSNCLLILQGDFLAVMPGPVFLLCVNCLLVVAHHSWWAVVIGGLQQHCNVKFMYFSYRRCWKCSPLIQIHAPHLKTDSGSRTLFLWIHFTLEDEWFLWRLLCMDWFKLIFLDILTGCGYHVQKLNVCWTLGCRECTSVVFWGCSFSNFAVFFTVTFKLLFLVQGA
jgi:hypothetical protein